MSETSTPRVDPALVTGLAVGVIVALVVVAYLLWPRPTPTGRTAASEGRLAALAVVVDWTP